MQTSWKCYKVDISIFRMYDANVTLSSEYRIAEQFPRGRSGRVFTVDFVRSACTELHDGMEISSSVLHDICPELFPFDVEVSDSCEIVGAPRWQNALGRVRKKLGNFHDKELKQIFLDSISSIDSEEEFIGMLLRSTFFQFFFRNIVGDSVLYFIYNYPKYGDVLPFVYSSQALGEGGLEQDFRAYLGKMDGYGSVGNRYAGIGKFSYLFEENGFPRSVDASFLIESEDEGFFKKEVHIARIFG